MASLQDPEIRRRYRKALEQRKVAGYVVWKGITVEWVARNLQGYSPPDVARAMWEYVCGGGRIDQVPEKRQEWSEHPYHYDLRLGIGNRELYIETVLYDDDPDDPVIQVVSIHDA